jgi:ABC-type antimicrobial peptide transport system ATPase subunit
MTDRPNHRRCEVHFTSGEVATLSADSETGESFVQKLLRRGSADKWQLLNGSLINLDNVTIIREVGR